MLGSLNLTSPANSNSAYKTMVSDVISSRRKIDVAIYMSTILKKNETIKLTALFFLFLAYSGLVYAAGRKKTH